MRRRHSAEGKLKFVCTVCGKDFLFKNEFVTHEYQHTQVRNFPCDICGRRYTSGSTLVQHMRSHEGIYDAGKVSYLDVCDCVLCSHGFLWARGVDSRVCSRLCLSMCPSLLCLCGCGPDAKRFQCYICKRMFTRATSVKTHMVVHSNEREFRCADCPKSFLDQRGLNRHSVTHKSMCMGYLFCFGFV